jgi:hypothetical protein
MSAPRRRAKRRLGLQPLTGQNEVFNGRIVDAITRKCKLSKGARAVDREILHCERSALSGIQAASPSTASQTHLAPLRVWRVRKNHVRTFETEPRLPVAKTP